MGFRDLFAFSTSWNWRGTEDGNRVADEILALGFDSIELNYKVTDKMLEDIRPRIARGELKISSVHNVFPDCGNALFDTDSRLLGYEDEAMRRRAVELTVRSAVLGAELGAKALVVHPGVMPWESLPPGPSGLRGPDYHARLCALYEEGNADTSQYRALLEEFAEYRKKGVAGELPRIMKSLEEVCEALARRSIPVLVGLENRPICWEIPDFEELWYILERLKGAPLGLWFDTGHGAILRRLGFFDDREEAAKFAPRLIGVHIHDSEGVSDHWAPYAKTDSLDGYLPIIAAAPIKVLELGRNNPAGTIPPAAERLAGKLFSGFGISR